jgi:NodT family efflux transporter outer membrane factor (OMF) lipoprotein
VTASAAVGRIRTSGEVGAGRSRTTELYSAGFDASWEPDVFGGTHRGIEAAQADLESSEASLNSTQVSLVSEVAVNYVEVRAFQARLAIARSNLESQSETLQLTEWRRQAGLASSLDVEQARANREQTRAQIPAFETSLAEAQHRIAILLGEPPGPISPKLALPAPIPAVPERIATGIPADTLRQRPDVRAAERKLAAETARIGQAAAARYPSLALTGSIGLEALTLGALGAGDALTHAFVASVGAVIFDAGRLRQQVEIQSAIQEQAFVAYQTAVLTALEDVENALVSLAMSRERETALRAATEAARNAALLARDRYTSGLIDFQTLLNTERTVLTLEDSLAATQAEGASALIQLYKALGGGWSTAAMQR